MHYGGFSVPSRAVGYLFPMGLGNYLGTRTCDLILHGSNLTPKRLFLVFKNIAVKFRKQLMSVNSSFSNFFFFVTG